MSTFRERNNLASKKSYKKSLEKQYATDYEYEVVRKHSENLGTEVCHWSVTPEDWLYEAGYITDYNKYRLERLIAKKEPENDINRLKDYGADGMIRIKDETGKYIYSLLQAKYYLSRKVTANDIGSFFASQLSLSCKDNRSKGYLYTTSPLQIDLADFIKHPSYPIKHIQHTWKHPDKRAEQQSAEQHTTDITQNECDLILRNYQQEALKELEEESDGEDGINALHIPCRMGKTVIAGHHIKNTKNKYKLIIALAPLRISVQNLKMRLKCFVPNYKELLVDSDTDGTTDLEQVKSFLKTDGNHIIYSTFDSAINILSKISNIEDKSFILVDEIHNASQEMCEFINTFQKGLCMSATIPEEITDILNINKTVYIPFSTGINDGWIVDYSIWLPYLSYNNNDGSSYIDVDIPNEFKKYNSDLTVKAMYLATVMLKTGSRRCIVYLNSKEECNDFMKTAKDIFENYHGLTLWTDKIDSDVSYKNRDKIINDFQHLHSDDVFHILTSVRILDEAVDIPRCDSVFITHIGQKSSDIRMVQRSQRSSTKDKNNINKHNNIILWADGWEKCVNSLDLLRETDPDFHKKIKVATCNYDSQNKKDIEDNIDKQINKINEYINIQSVSVWERQRLHWISQYDKLQRNPLQKSINKDERKAGLWQAAQRCCYKKKENRMTSERIKILEGTSGWKWEEDDNWEVQRQKWIKQYNKLGKSPSPSSKNTDEKSTANWQHNQRQIYRKKENRMTQERIKILERTPGWKWDEEDNWEIQRQCWIIQYRKIGKIPSEKSKDIDEKKAGKWKQHQRQNYKKKEKCMTQERIKILEETPGWKWEEDDNWEIQRQHWIEQYNKLEKKPSQSSKNKDEKKAGQWQSDQRKDFKNKEKCITSERIKLLEETIGWKWSGK
jgi:superfamily II DNA or RNA helicase